MRIFGDLNVAYEEIRRDLLETGVWHSGHSYQDKVVEGDERFDFMELSPYLWTFTDPGNHKKLLAFIDEQDLDLNWISFETSERMFLSQELETGDERLNPGKAWKLREVWEPFIEDTGQFSYTYANRFSINNQWEWAIEELTEHPTSRQVIIGVHDWKTDNLNAGGTHRIPCSMFYHLMIRDEKLNLHYVMRSCDIHTHFPYDVILALHAQILMARWIEIECGVFSHFVTSLHGFKKDFGSEVF